MLSYFVYAKQRHSLFRERFSNYRRFSTTAGLAIGWMTEEQSAINEYQQ